MCSLSQVVISVNNCNYCDIVVSPLLVFFCITTKNQTDISIQGFSAIKAQLLI